LRYARPRSRQEVKGKRQNNNDASRTVLDRRTFSFAFFLQILVLGEGFEPSQSLSPPGLQPGAINHSTTPALYRARLNLRD
jgi:hypothetical protein